MNHNPIKKKKEKTLKKKGKNTTPPHPAQIELNP